MDFARPVLLFIVGVIGGLISVSLLIALILLSLTALIDVKQLDSRIYPKICRIVGIVVLVFALFTPFRYVSSIGIFLSAWWTIQLFDFVQIYKLEQLAANSALSFIFWCFREKRKTDYTIMILADIFLFSIIPAVFTMVLNSESESLVDGVKSHVPLQKYLRRIGSFINDNCP